MSGVEENWRKGPWTGEEDRLLVHHVNVHGEGRWNTVATLAATPQEEALILDLHARWGNRWSTIARSLPGRTDNEIKNYWRTLFKKESKGASDESTKLKTRLLMKRQKFQPEQRQRLMMQQNEADMKKVMTLLLEETENKVGRYMPL
ncbi:transcription factor MYB2-like protein [Tanacetum coccineum]